MLAWASVVDRHFLPPTQHFRENLDRRSDRPLLLLPHFQHRPFLLIPCSFLPFPQRHLLKHSMDPLPPFWPTWNRNQLLFVEKMGRLSICLKQQLQKPLRNRQRWRQIQILVHPELPLLALVVL